MKITKFDLPSLRLISADIETALKPIAEKYGITFTYKGARFTASNATFKVEGITIGTDGVTVSKERQDFLQYHSLFNLPKEVLDQEVNFAGDVYLITGLNTRSQKYPVTAKRVSDGREFKLGADGVRNSWERKNKVLV
jgi:hypothetical protein